MGFKDHFSAHAAVYAQSRPDYPPQLFKDLADLCDERGTAWDCATGNGQAAVALACCFELVIASDASSQQLDNARTARNIDYRVMAAESATMPDESIDLVTVAQALHWFDIPRFFGEVNRVLKQGGLLAVWSYGLQRIDPVLDKLVHYLYQDLVGEFWPPERRLVEQGYRSIEFPFSAVDAPGYTLTKQWSLPQLLAYLESWSAVQRFTMQHGSNPVERVTAQLADAWGAQDTREVNWPLTLFIRRK